MAPHKLEDETLIALRAARKAMDSIDFVDALEDRSKAERKAAAETLLAVVSAIRKGEVAQLKDIREDLDKEKDNLKAAIDELKDALKDVEDTVEVVAKANKLLSVVAKFAKVLVF